MMRRPCTGLKLKGRPILGVKQGPRGAAVVPFGCYPEPRKLQNLHVMMS